MITLVTQATVRANGTALVLARLRKLATGYALALPVAADFTSIARTATSLRTGAVIAGPTSLTPSDVVFASLSTEGGWSRDATGWNFADLVPASLFPASPGTRLTYQFTMTGGVTFFLDVDCSC